MIKQHLRMAGPTELPHQVINSMQRPMINHRGDEFVSIFKTVSEGIKEVFQTNNDVLIFPASGTGAMEAAIVNCFSPRDLIVSFPNGVFSERFAKIAEAYGADVERIPVEWGKPVTPDIVKARVSQDVDHKIKGILLTHNETSTGVLNDVKALREALGDHPALVLVDAVSSLGAVDLKPDEWGLDVVVTGSQKALMLPPGLGFISVSSKAWACIENSRMPKYYWDFKAAKKKLMEGQTPYTPSISLIYALERSLEIIKSEGLSNIFERHLTLASAFREGIKELGLEIFAEERCASPTVTAVKLPEGKKDIANYIRDNYGITMAGGQGELKGKICRLGHLGYVDKMDIINALAAFEMSLGDVELYGKGIRAAENIFAKEKTK